MKQPSGKLGELYLGADFDPVGRQVLDAPVYVDSSDLVTHGVCIGMTGSGKTGLCVSLLEECALNDIPALVIDPKGDLTNLALVFPQLDAGSFRPWVNEENARRKGIEPDAYAAAEAQKWREGLAGWGITPEHLARYRERVDVTLLTPGSTAGTPVNVLSSFDAPANASDMDPELLREQIAGTVSALLGLLGVASPTSQDREHILLATLLEHRWLSGAQTTLTDLIHLIQAPPIQKLGALDLDTFYPPDDRRKFAFQLNALVASPSFQSWLDGEPLDIASLLRAPDGRPRLAVCTLSHLGDAERMFFIALLLSQFVSWMRRQPGTSNLKALLYFDEIFGYLPPHPKNPPSKHQLMTILKQGRATGTSAMLVTQNPVDLDYKALSNCGLWLLGKLQTDQDKARILDGLSGAIDEAGDTGDRNTLDRMLASLGARVFLLHNIHAGAPRLMHSRWAMSYLAGPMTRAQIRQLTQNQKSAAAGQPAAAAEEPDTLNDFLGTANADPALPDGTSLLNVPPAPPKGLSRRFAADARAGATCAASIYALADVVFRERGGGVATRTAALVIPQERLTSPDLSWRNADFIADLGPTTTQAPDNGRFRPLPAAASLETFKSLGATLVPHIVENFSIDSYTCPALGLESHLGESREDFGKRVSEVVFAEVAEREAKLRETAEKAIAREQARIDRETAELERDREMAATRRGEEMMSTLTTIGSTLLSILGARRKSSAVGKVGTAMRRVTSKRGMTKRAEMAVKESEQAIAAAQSAIEGIRQKLDADIAAVKSELEAAASSIEVVPLRPAKSNVTVREIGYLWIPVDKESQA